MANFKITSTELNNFLVLNLDNFEPNTIAMINEAVTGLNNAILYQQETDRLTREITIALNGDNAVEASLADILLQIKREHDIRLLGGITVEQLIEPVKPGVVLTGLPVTQAGSGLPGLDDVFSIDQAIALAETFELRQDVSADNLPIEHYFPKKGLPAVDDVPEDVTLYDSLDHRKSNDPDELKGRLEGNTDNVLYDGLLEGDTTAPILWSEVADVYKFAAIDKNGRLSVFTHKPTADAISWFIYVQSVPKTEFIRQRTHKQLNREFPNWKNTLVERPEND